MIRPIRAAHFLAAMWLFLSGARGADLDTGTFGASDLTAAADRFFADTSASRSLLLRQAIEQWGEPVGYILGREGSGAVFGGLRFGEGTLFLKPFRDRPIFWQGPSLGLDIGGAGGSTMFLVYNLRDPETLFGRFMGLNGSAYLGAGIGLAAAIKGDITIVRLLSGLGARLEFNVGYLKFTPERDWNPF